MPTSLGSQSYRFEARPPLVAGASVREGFPGHTAPPEKIAANFAEVDRLSGRAHRFDELGAGVACRFHRLRPGPYFAGYEMGESDRSPPRAGKHRVASLTNDGDRGLEPSRATAVVCSPLDHQTSAPTEKLHDEEKR